MTQKIHPSSGETETGDTDSSNQNTSAEQELDVELLAGKVYNLLRQEILLERERLGHKNP